MPLWTRAGVEEHVAGIFNAMRDVVCAGDRPRPLAIVYAKRDIVTGIPISEPVPIGIPIPGGKFDEDARRMFAAKIRQSTKELDAIGTLIIFDSYFRFKDPKDPDAKVERREVVVALLEHKEIGEIQWLATLDLEGRRLGEHETLLDITRKAHPNATGVNPVGIVGSFERMLPERWMN